VQGKDKKDKKDRMSFLAPWFDDHAIVVFSIFIQHNEHTDNIQEWDRNYS
jgi:hypothetical protein